MDPNSIKAGAAAAGGANEGLYIDEIFNTTVFHGTGYSNRAITTGLDMSGEGGLILGKKRTGVKDWYSTSTDSAANVNLQPNTTAAQATNTEIFKSFTSTGFTVGSDAAINDDGQDFKTYSWRKAPGFFDIVTYAGNNTNRDIAHSLGTNVGMMWIRPVDGVSNWYVWHKHMGDTSSDQKDYYLRLSTANSRTAGNSTTWHQNPTSTHFSVGSGNTLNASGYNYVCYLFADSSDEFGKDGDASVVKTGVYTGAGDSNTSAQSIDLGWTPQFVLIKNITDNNNYSDWVVFDSQSQQSMSTHAVGNRSYWNKLSDDDAEVSTKKLGFYNKGFHIHKYLERHVNTENKKFIYYAIRKVDGVVGKPLDDGRNAFHLDGGTGGTGWPDKPYFHNQRSYNVPANYGWPVAAAWVKKISSGVQDWNNSGRSLATYGFTGMNTDDNVESISTFSFDFKDGFGQNGNWNSDYVGFMWREHKGFSEQVYFGTGSSQNVNHWLGIKPEIIFTKQIDDDSRDWICYHKNMSTSQYGLVNEKTSSVVSSDASCFGSGDPFTDTTFTVNTSNHTNESGKTYWCQLWASVPGISKCGTFTGSSSTFDVTLGFQPRFMWVKNITDDEKGWMIFNTVGGWFYNGVYNDYESNKVLSMNDNGDYSTPAAYAADDQNYPVCWPISTGVRFSGSEQFYGNLNSNGKTFIYYAHI